MKIFILVHILFVVSLFSKTESAHNSSFTFKPMILSEESTFSKVEPCSIMFSVKEDDDLTSFQELFQDYPFILYLDGIYQNIYKYSNINAVIFKDENNLLSLLSTYDVNRSKIKLSIKYNFK